MKLKKKKKSRLLALLPLSGTMFTPHREQCVIIWKTDIEEGGTKSVPIKECFKKKRNDLLIILAKKTL